MHSDQKILQEQYELLRSQHSSVAQQHDEAMLRVAELEEDAAAGGGSGVAASRATSRLISAQTQQLEGLVGQLADELEQARRSEKAALTQLYALQTGGGSAAGPAVAATHGGAGSTALPLSAAAAGVAGFPATAEPPVAGGGPAAVFDGAGEDAIGRDEAYSMATSVLADRDREL
eukprot:SAG22_NODE_485_length_9905_cov_35.562003_6_plen_175_part_00